MTNINNSKILGEVNYKGTKYIATDNGIYKVSKNGGKLKVLEGQEMKIKKCQECGSFIAGPKNKRFCLSCASFRHSHRKPKKKSIEGWLKEDDLCRATITINPERMVVGDSIHIGEPSVITFCGKMLDPRHVGHIYTFVVTNIKKT